MVHFDSDKKTGRFNGGDSDAFVVGDALALSKFLEKNDIELKCEFERVYFYVGAVQISGDLRVAFDDGQCTLVAVDGDLTVDGAININDSDGLLVIGNVKTNSFATYEGLVEISGTLEAAEKAEFLAVDAAEGCQSVHRILAPLLRTDNPDNIGAVTCVKESKIDSVQSV
jgi:hypothetical protein